MPLSRRQFNSRVILAAAASTLPLTLMGCNIFSDILAWTAVASTAIDGIVTVLGSFLPPGGAQIVQAIKAALSSLAGAVSEYQSDTNPADKATLLAKIRTFLGDIATNIQSLLNQVAPNAPIINVVLGLAQIILAAISGFLNELPVPTGAAKSVTLGASITIRGRVLDITPKYYKRASDFKKDFNAACAAAGHPEAEIK